MPARLGIAANRELDLVCDPSLSRTRCRDESEPVRLGKFVPAGLRGVARLLGDARLVVRLGRQQFMVVAIDQHLHFFMYHDGLTSQWSTPLPFIGQLPHETSAMAAFLISS